MNAVLFPMSLLQVSSFQPSGDQVLADFSQASEREWFTVNDGVMGGVSSSGMSVTSDGVGIFRGWLSLDNNGGFASVRTDLRGRDLSEFSGLVLRVRGDGRQYQVRLRTQTRYRLAYRADFSTRPNEWQTVVVPFADFRATVRGYTPPNAPPLNLAAVDELGLLLGDGREGAFQLEVEFILAVRGLSPDQN